MNYSLQKSILHILLLFCIYAQISFASADNLIKSDHNKESVYLLTYKESELGTDAYKVKMYVSKRFIRIEEGTENSGYLLFDDKLKKIYSISYEDESIFVIKSNQIKKTPPIMAIIDYKKLAGAPKIAGRTVYSYQVYAKRKKQASDKKQQLCINIQLVENLLPRVTKILYNYQTLLAKQQINLTDNKLTDTQDGCYFLESIYNVGSYYLKGLPLQENYHNGKIKLLTDYKKVMIDKEIFSIPKQYRQFSIDNATKMSL